MRLFDIFKKKKSSSVPLSAGRREDKGGKKEVKPCTNISLVQGKEKPAVKIESPDSGGKRKTFIAKKPLASAHQILKFPHITEKATQLTEKNQYTFRVWQRANKTEVKKAVEGLYGVDVLDVKILNVPPKQRRLGKITGQKKGYKKAIVKLAEGQKIEVLPR